MKHPFSWLSFFCLSTNLCPVPFLSSSKYAKHLRGSILWLVWWTTNGGTSSANPWCYVVLCLCRVNPCCCAVVLPCKITICRGIPDQNGPKNSLHFQGWYHLHSYAKAGRCAYCITLVDKDLKLDQVSNVDMFWVSSCTLPCRPSSSRIRCACRSQSKPCYKTGVILFYANFCPFGIFWWKQTFKC